MTDIPTAHRRITAILDEVDTRRRRQAAEPRDRARRASSPAATCSWRTSRAWARRSRRAPSPRRSGWTSPGRSSRPTCCPATSPARSSTTSARTSSTFRKGPRVHRAAARRRDQPHAAQDAVRAARGDAGGPGHRRGRDLPARPALPRPRDRQPRRVRRHLPPARGPARPVPRCGSRFGYPDGRRRSGRSSGAGWRGASEETQVRRRHRRRGADRDAARRRDVTVDESVGQYCVRLAAGARAHHEHSLMGASPRGSLALLLVGRAYAVLRGRDYVTPEDVKAVAHAALDHRVVVRPELWMNDVSARSVVADLLRRCRRPARRCARRERSAWRPTRALGRAAARRPRPPRRSASSSAGPTPSSSACPSSSLVRVVARRPGPSGPPGAQPGRAPAAPRGPVGDVAGRRRGRRAGCATSSPTSPVTAGRRRAREHGHVAAAAVAGRATVPRRPSSAAATRWGLRRLGPAQVGAFSDFGVVRLGGPEQRVVTAADRADPGRLHLARRAPPPRRARRPEPVPPPGRRQRARPTSGPSASATGCGASTGRCRCAPASLHVTTTHADQDSRGAAARRRHARPRRARPRARGAAASTTPSRRPGPSRSTTCAPATGSGCSVLGGGGLRRAPRGRRAPTSCAASSTPSPGSSVADGTVATRSGPARAAAPPRPARHPRRPPHPRRLARAARPRGPPGPPRHHDVIVVDTLPARPGAPDAPDDRSSAAATRARGRPIGPARLAAAAARARSARPGAAREAGVPVVPWAGPGTLDLVLRDLGRRTRAPRVATR